MAWRGNNIGHQLSVSIYPPTDRGDLLQTRMFNQGSFDFPDFNSMTPHLHLKVFTPRMENQSVGFHSAYVTGAVDSQSGSFWCRGKLRCRLFGLPPVSQGQITALDCYLPDRRPIDCLARLLVQQHHLAILNGIAHRDPVDTCLSRFVYEVTSNPTDLCSTHHVKKD